MFIFWFFNLFQFFLKFFVYLIFSFCLFIIYLLFIFQSFLLFCFLFFVYFLFLLFYVFSSKKIKLKSKLNISIFRPWKKEKIIISEKFIKIETKFKFFSINLYRKLCSIWWEISLEYGKKNHNAAILWFLASKPTYRYRCFPSRLPDRLAVKARCCHH